MVGYDLLIYEELLMSSHNSSGLALHVLSADPRVVVLVPQVRFVLVLRFPDRSLHHVDGLVERVALAGCLALSLSCFIRQGADHLGKVIDVPIDWMLDLLDSWGVSLIAASLCCDEKSLRF